MTNTPQGVLSLAELGLDPSRDVGRVWHPGPEKFCEDGILPDLSDDEVAEHLAKPEAQAAEGLLEAESSAESAEGAV